MITSIHLKNVATYQSPEGCSLDGLSKINFLYGTNGTGKTTITKVINDCGRFPECSLAWHEGNELTTYVYNEEFVRRNFYESDLPGVFTLGSDSVGIQESVQQKSEELTRIQESQAGLQRAIASEQQNIETFKDAFKERCWNEKLRYEDEYGLTEAFTGFRGSKASFRDQTLSFLEDGTELIEIEEIKERALTIFAESHNTVPTYQLFDLQEIFGLEAEGLLAEPIVGTEGVPIADLITHLDNSDWVKRGRIHLNNSDGRCPFCQEAIDVEKFKSDLERFFDETYDRKMQAIRTFSSTYERLCGNLVARIESVLENPTGFFEIELLSSELETIRRTVDLNRATIANKLDKPSEEISLQPITPLVETVNNKLTEANEKISKHNATIADLENQKGLLKTAVWKHIAETVRSDYDSMQEQCSNIQRGINGRTLAMQSKSARIQQLTREISALENKVTTTGPTITAINDMLVQFGFNSFSLASTDDQRFYKIVRENGEEAKDTLSEGEKTFLTFLYFYHSLRGNSHSAGLDAYKVVVIDDPISSLDSNVLFIVSTLLRNLINSVREGTSVVRQIFLLTHNTYFHKEVTFRYEGNDFTFWIVKKPDGNSTLEKYDTNPVVSMYELLWIEVRESTGINVQNAMRRILEYYFKNLGGIGLDDNLVDRFEGSQKIYCRSLLSWLHDGSHSIIDDLHVVNEEQNVQTYKDVFRQIFVHMGHENHYIMMMS
jgi:wobble nucleotide-excising tRNase